MDIFFILPNLPLKKINASRSVIRYIRPMVSTYVSGTKGFWISAALWERSHAAHDAVSVK